MASGEIERGFALTGGDGHRPPSVPHGEGLCLRGKYGREAPNQLQQNNQDGSTPTYSMYGKTVRASALTSSNGQAAVVEDGTTGLAGLSHVQKKTGVDLRAQRQRLGPNSPPKGEARNRHMNDMFGVIELRGEVIHRLSMAGGGEPPRGLHIKFIGRKQEREWYEIMRRHRLYLDSR